MSTPNADQKAVLVTGAASGIGLDIATLLHEIGWVVHLLDREQGRLATEATELGLGPDRIHCADVTDEAAIEAILAKVNEGGALGGLVNSAGIAMDKLIVDTEVAEFRRLLEVNLIGSFILSRAAARNWLARGQPGSIVNLSSVSGILGSRGRGAYGSSKAGINQLTRVLATELRQQNIRVNAIAPGAIDTPLSRAVHTPAIRNQYEERIPVARYGTVREISEAVAFLLSPKSSYITGQVLAIDGGFSTSGLRDAV